VARGARDQAGHRAPEEGAGPPGPSDRKTYRRRNIIERCVSTLKWFRRVATRYEKLATHYLGMVTLAIIFRLLG
jgi:transposase